jgi:hypothetical protein
MRYRKKPVVIEAVQYGGEGEHESDDPSWPFISHCDWCRGEGGTWGCMEDREWCEANPMPGREHVPSPASEREP